MLGVNSFGDTTGGESVNRVATDRAPFRRRRIHQEGRLVTLVCQGVTRPVFDSSLTRYEQNSASTSLHLMEEKLAIKG